MAKKKKNKKKQSSKAAYDEKKRNAKNLSHTSKKPKDILSDESSTVGIPEETITADVENETSAATGAASESVEAKEEITASDINAEKKERDASDKDNADPSEGREDPEPQMPASPGVAVPFDPDFTEEDFSMSVKELDTKDIKVSEENEGKKKKKKKKLSKTENIIQFSILGVCGVVAIICLVMLGENIWGKIRGQQIYEDVEFHGFTIDELMQDDGNLASISPDTPLLNLFDRIEAGESAQIPESDGKYDTQLSQMKASLSALKAKNDDIYGWIYVEGTSINHPVVRGEDNDYYLDHAYTGNEYLTIGSIFADCTTKDLITDNFNTVIYGHNVMSSGESSMFHDVQTKIAQDESFFRTCRIYIYTMDGVFVYKPVSVYDTVADYLYFRTGFNSEGEFLSFAQEMVSNSHYYTGEKFHSGDTMLTLSTCTNGATDGRYALHAKLVEVVK